MSRIPVFGLGQASKSPFVTAKLLQNMYAEQRPEGEKSMMVGFQTPGETLFTDFGGNPSRGGHGVRVAVRRLRRQPGTLWEVNNAGTQTNRGALLTTTGRVSIADNGTQIMIVDGTYGYIYNTSTNVFAQIVDVDFPAKPVTVTFLAGRFIVNLTGSSRFYVSDLYDGTSWDALNFANAETSPDPISAVLASNGQLILLGTRTTEYWGLSGSLDFAFVLIAGTATEWGIAATWSLAKYDNSFACLIKNRMGQVMVAQINGYLPKKISTSISTPSSTATRTSRMRAPIATCWAASDVRHQLPEREKPRGSTTARRASGRSSRATVLLGITPSSASRSSIGPSFGLRERAALHAHGERADG
jgi:hypothetical protein